jgi:hypothetical protein
MPRRAAPPSDEPLSDDAEKKAPPSREQKRGPSRKKDLAALVGAVNELLVSFEGTRPDALSEPEGELLVNGLDKAQQQSPTLQRYFKSAGQASGWLALTYAVTVIGLPRLARHNLIPAVVGERLRGMVQRSGGAADTAAQPVGTPPPPPAGMPVVPPIYAPGNGTLPSAEEYAGVASG